METSPDRDQRALIAALLNPAVHGLAPEERIDALETHISHVLLAGRTPTRSRSRLPPGVAFNDAAK